MTESGASQAGAAAPDVLDDGDFEWARDRVVKMWASALVDAQVYQKKLLKGFGYPDETFRAAADYRALGIVLRRLDALSAAHKQFNERLAR